MRSALMDRTGELESNGRKLVALEIETSAIQRMLPASVGSVIAWQVMMGKCVMRLIKEVVKQIDYHIKTAEAQIRLHLPVLQPAFDKDIYKADLGNEVCGGQQARVVSDHNRLHAMMQAGVAMFTDLRLQQSMADHPATKATSAVAAKTLQDCKDAAKVCRGTDILRQKDSIAGIKAAQDFVAKNIEQFKHLPALFWSELNQVAAYSLPAGTDSPAKVASPPKSEPLLDGSGSGSSLAMPVTPCSGPASNVSRGSDGKSSAPTKSAASAPRKGLKRSRA